MELRFGTTRFATRVVTIPTHVSAIVRFAALPHHMRSLAFINFSRLTKIKPINVIQLLAKNRSKSDRVVLIINLDRPANIPHGKSTAGDLAFMELRLR